ncbi:hypothetical protein ACH4TQ_27355 [Streptomyces sp. NPDC021218]|uniref:hypothetical protein n=1 Tax=Streptomyces sp. NPDC021218 TaxID=3365119 RepID=UPI0037AB3597
MNAKTRKAALVVADRSRGPADCRQLLEALGLVLPAPKRRGRPRGEYDHGHPAKYAQGCRCDACRAANTRRCARIRADSVADPTRADRAGHGKASTYSNHGCRCDACQAANKEKSATQRAARKARAA